MALQGPTGVQSSSENPAIQYILDQLRLQLNSRYGTTESKEPAIDQVILGLVHDQPSLVVVGYFQDEGNLVPYQLPLVVTDRQEVGQGSVSRRELGDLLGGHAYRVPDGTQVIKAFSFIPDSDITGTIYTPQILFSDDEINHHGIGVSADGKPQRYEHITTQGRFDVRRIQNGTGEVQAIDWNTQDLPHLQDLETGLEEGYGRRVMAVGPRYIPPPNRDFGPFPSPQESPTELLLQRGTRKIVPLHGDGYLISLNCEPCNAVFDLQLFRLPVPKPR